MIFRDDVIKQIKEWNNTTIEKDGIDKYVFAQFGIGYSYIQKKEYDKSCIYFDNIYNIRYDFIYYVLCKISRFLKQYNSFEFDVFFELLLFQEEIMDQLYIDFSTQFERKLAHYTSSMVANQLLEKNGKLRLNNIYSMNDPTEGMVLFNYLSPKILVNDDYGNIQYSSFVSCFTLNHDSLNQFRLYGKNNQKEATGLSLVFDKIFFNLDFDNFSSVKTIDELRGGDSTNKKLTSTLGVYRCIYIDPETKYLRLAQRDKMTFYREFYQDKKLEDEIEKLWNKYQQYMQEKEHKIKSSLKKIQMNIESIFKSTVEEDIIIKVSELIQLILLPLQYLVKHSAFQEEQECRMCYITSLSDPCITMDFDKKWLYIDYPEPVKDHITNVYIATGAKEYYPFIVRLLGENSASKVQLSKNPFRIAG